MNVKKAKVFLIFILLVASIIPMIDAPSIEVSPVDTTDDAFITGIGAYFGDTEFLPLRDAVQNIIIGTRFRNVSIPQGTKINNATLFVRSIYGYGPASNITVTIAGDDSDDSASFNDSGSFTRAYTGAFQVWDISEIEGNDWYNVSVTEIVQEIIDRVGWTSGNDLSLVFFTDKGTPRREFASVDGNPAYTAFLNITYAEAPPPTAQDQANPPYNDTDVYDWTYVNTTRGIDIWIITFVNRTGINVDLNWETLNVTELTEFDPGGDIVRQNDTWVDVDNLNNIDQAQLHNDTGANDLNTAFIRFKVLHTDVTSGEVGNAVGSTMFAVATVDTHAYQGGGNGVFVFVQINPDDVRYRYLLQQRDGVGNQVTSLTGWFNEGHGFDYIEIYVNSQGAGDTYTQWSMWSDETYTIQTDFDKVIHALGGDNWRWGYIASSSAQALDSVSHDFDFYTFLEAIDIGSETFLVYPNGTLVDPDPLPEDVNPDDAIDDLLGGAQPEDPEEDKYISIDKFTWKLMVLIVGMIMLIGSPIAGVTFGADSATWIKILYVMFFGIGILWQLKFM